MEFSAGDLPRDVALEILSLLPLKALLQFKSVCKSWESLLKSPKLVAIYNHNKKGRILAQRYFSCPIVGGTKIIKTALSLIFTSDFSYQDLDIHPRMMEMLDWRSGFFCQHHGIICLSPSHISTSIDANGDPNDSVFLCNPWTKEFKVHPQLQSCLPFPSTSPSLPPKQRPVVTALGFGHDPGTDQYKVVRIVDDYGGDHNCPESAPNKRIVQVCTLGEDSWREVTYNVKCPKPAIVRDNQRPSLYFNGACHWIEIDQILSFNVANESFQLITGIWPNDKSLCDCELMVWKESLALFYYQPVSYQFELWVMKDYGVKESWVKLIDHITSPAVANRLPWVLVSAQKSMTLFDLIQVKQRGANDPKIRTATFPFEESLVSLKGGDQSDALTDRSARNVPLRQSSSRFGCHL